MVNKRAKRSGIKRSGATHSLAQQATRKGYPVKQKYVFLWKGLMLQRKLYPKIKEEFAFKKQLLGGHNNFCECDE